MKHEYIHVSRDTSGVTRERHNIKMLKDYFVTPRGVVRAL
jgi:hypothetical protein